MLLNLKDFLWTAKADMPNIRSAFHACSLTNDAEVLVSTAAKAYVYNIRDNTWRPIGYIPFELQGVH